MKKILIIIILFFSKTYSQELKGFSIPENLKKIAEAKGDLDKDGIDEIVFAYETNKIDQNSSFSRELYICKIVNEKVKIWKKNTSVLWKTDEFGPWAEDKKINLKISNNTIIIEQTSYGSPRGYTSYRNVYRYQNTDWFVIGSTCVAQSNCLFEDTFDINFSTKKVNVIKDYETCEDGKEPLEKDETLSFKYPFKNIPSMDDFTPGKNEYMVPNRKYYFFY